MIKVNDIVYSIRGVNKIKGKVFDRLGIIISTVKEVRIPKNKDEELYCISTNNECIYHPMQTLAAAKNELSKRYNECKNVRFLVHKNEEIVIIDNSTCVSNFKQLSIFDLEED